MATQPRFCANCGTPLAPGANFCPACGRPTAAPVAQPSQQPPPTAVYQTPPPPAYAPAYAQPAARPRRRTNFLVVAGLVLVVLLVLFFLARLVALQAFGETTLATVTSVEETGEEDYQYVITYRFVTADGTVVNGSATREEPNVGNLPQVGSQIPVRYLPFWPTINQWGK